MRNKGFTLIELLVVISIIGLLASIVLSSLSAARGKARDVRRLSDMHTLQVALELYITKNAVNGVYPVAAGGAAACSGWETTGNDAGSFNFIAPVTSDADLPAGIKDPSPSLESACGNYAYARYNPGDYGCPVSRGGYYVVGIRTTDTGGTNRYPSSPGWSCSGRDWQTEFSWVTGVFEH